MNQIRRNKWYWIVGTAVALVGVAAVRLLSPALSGISQKVLMCLGYFLSLSGIVIMAYGSKDRREEGKTG